jgi:hypothetical protein
LHFDLRTFGRNDRNHIDLFSIRASSGSELLFRFLDGRTSPIADAAKILIVIRITIE